MSYSYIKSVFPNFEESKVYDDRLYNSLSSIGTGLLDGLDGNIPKQIESFTQNLANKVVKKEENTKDNLKFYNQPIPFIYNQENEHAIYDSSKTIYKNIKNNSNTNTKSQLKNHVENFTIKSFAENFDNDNEDNNKELNCDAFFKHLLECENCKRKFVKQYNLDKDKIKQDEMMEMASYMIFGIFILLLLDTLKQK